MEKNGKSIDDCWNGVRCRKKYSCYSALQVFCCKRYFRCLHSQKESFSHNRKEQMLDRLEQWLIEGMTVEGKRLINAYK